MEHFIDKNGSYTTFEDVSFIFQPQRKMSLDLKLPEPQPEPDSLSYTHIEEPRQSRRDTILERCRPISFPLTAWVGSLLFTIIYCMFIYHILIVGNPQIGSWTFEASLTNLLLSIMSQVYAMLLMFMALGLLDALRWTLAASTERGGASASSFFQLSPATDWLSVFKFIYDSRFRNLWGLLRLSLPFMGLGFGSILKFQNTFEYHFIPEGPTIDVYAGNIPPDISIINEIPASYMTGYHDTWAQGLQNYPRYTYPWKMEGCGENCTVFFLPGGMEIARKIGASMDATHTILQGGIFNQVESVSIERAPGLIAEFQPLPEGFVFDLDECTSYVTPRGLSDGVQFCLRQMGDSVAAGWRGCPTFYQEASICHRTDLWAKNTTNIKATTMMTVYRQNATTMYDRSDLSIKHIEATSKPLLVRTSAEDSQKIWDRIFVPDGEADLTDRQSINITIHRLAWKYRTYTEFFPDHNVPRELLSNFMAVPLQFAVTAMQYANYTNRLPPEKQGFPKELTTTATGGRSIEKFVSPLWTAWTFIISSICVVLITGAGFLYVLMQRHPIPRPSGITELDFATKLANGQVLVKDENSMVKEGVTDLVRELKAQESYTAWSIVKTLRGRRLELNPEMRSDGTEDAIHFPVLRMTTSSLGSSTNTSLVKDEKRALI